MTPGARALLVLAIGGCAPDERPGADSGDPSFGGTPRLGFDGRRPAWVSTTPGPAVARCAVSPVADVDTTLVLDPTYVQAYRSGASGCGVPGPYEHGTTWRNLAHHQGIQRLHRDGVNHYVVSDSMDRARPAGIEVVELPFGPGSRDALGSTAAPGGWPDCGAHLAAWSVPPGSTMDHASGLQVVGDFAIVPFERQDDSQTAGFRVADLSTPSAPAWGSLARRVRGQTTNAGALAAFQASTGTYVAMVFGNDSDDVEVFASTTPTLSTATGWTSTWREATPGAFEAYQNVQAVPACDGALYLLGTHKNNAMEDWADLWQVTFADPVGWNPAFTKVANAHLVCSSARTGGARYCDLDAGGGAWVDETGRVVIYGIEHHDDAVSGNDHGVKVREFPSH